MKNRIKAHLKEHVKIYVPLAVIVAIITATVVTYADDYYYMDSPVWDYSGPVWTPTIPSSTYSSGTSSTTTTTNTTTTAPATTSTTTSTSTTSTSTTGGCPSYLVPAGGVQVVLDKTTHAVRYYDTNRLIPEIIWKSGVSYIYMKNADGVGDYNYLVGNVCKITKEGTWGFIMPDKIEASLEKMEEEANRVFTVEELARSLECEDVPAGAVKIKFDDETYDVRYYSNNSIVSGAIGRDGASYLYFKNPETGRGDYDYVVGYTCGYQGEIGYIYPEFIEEVEDELGVIAANVEDVATDIPPAGYEEFIDGTTENPFTDTDSSTLLGQAATDLYNRAVIGGYDDGEFKGDRPVNRAEAAKFLLLARKITVEDGRNNGRFKDVSSSAWYSKYVMKAASLGIINGYNDGSFRPGSTVTTVEFLKMLAVTFDLQEDLEYTYNDVAASAWYAKYVGIAEYYDLFPERLGKELKPAQELTREEVAVAIYKILLYLGE